MARVAGCPQCSHELFVPDDADVESWAKCPECRAFFQVKQATLREVPAIMLVDAAPDVANEDDAIEDQFEPRSAPTLADFSSTATLSEPEAVELQLNEMANFGAETLDLSVGDDEPHDDLAATKQRIDQLLGSTKESDDFTSAAADDDLLPELDEPIDELDRDSADTGATVYYDPATAVDALNSVDFDLEESAEPDRSPAAWDDTTEMEDLLADIDTSPADELEPADAPVAAFHDDADSPTSVSFTPELTSEPVVARAGARRRKRSPVRMLVMIVLGGLLGVGGGYYALLWLRGPSSDFLEVAQYLPQVMLPSSFNNQPRQLAVNTQPSAPAPADTTGETEEAEQAEVETTEPTEPAEFAANTSPETTDDTPEMPASYTTTEEPAADTAASANDRYAINPNESETPEVQPLDLEESRATPLDDAPLAETAATEAVEQIEVSSPPADEARVANAPTFTTDELLTALEEAKKAQTSLMTGSLSDSREVAHAKGFGYSMLADLAQKAAFVDSAAPADTVGTLQQATDDLFRQTLSDAHTRGEVAQILPKWLGSRNRKHGGVFFAASITSPESKGSVTEFRAELESGQVITVLVPAAAAQGIGESARPVAVIGWVVDQPVDHVSGYTGSAPQAIWVSRLIPLK